MSYQMLMLAHQANSKSLMLYEFAKKQLSRYVQYSTRQSMGRPQILQRLHDWNLNIN